MGCSGPFMNWVALFCSSIAKYCITSLSPAGQEKLCAIGGDGGAGDEGAVPPQLQRSQQRIGIEIEMIGDLGSLTMSPAAPTRNGSRAGLDQKGDICKTACSFWLR